MRDNYKKNTNDPADLGCIIIIGLIILPFVLSAIFQALLPFIIVGAIGFAAYRLYIYDTRTGNVTKQLEELFGVKDKQHEIHEIDATETSKALPSASEDELALLKQKIETLELENKAMREENQKDIENALQDYTENISNQQKKQLLDQFFQNDQTTYARSDEFELQDHAKQIADQKNEMELRKIKQEMRERLFDTEKQGHETRLELKEELGSFKEEVRKEFKVVYTSLGDLEKSIITLRAYVDNRFSQFEVIFYQTISEVKSTIVQLRSEIKEDMATMKVEFGKEIVRIDKQQMQIVSQLEKYEATIKKFTYDVMQTKVQAEKFANRAEHYLNRANIVYHKHQTQIQSLSKDLDMSLMEISIHKRDFANTVGQAKLRLDEVSMNQYHALKEIGFERAGVEMLRSDHTKRVESEKQKMLSIQQDIRHIEDKIKLHQNNEAKTSQLRHQLYISQENLQTSRNRNSLLQQEQAVFRKAIKGGV